MVSTSRDRAQLVLIGAIAVALLVIGIALVVNAVLYTENVQPSESASQLDEAREIDHEVRRSTRSLVLRVNHQSRDQDADELASGASGNVSNLGELLGESYVNSRPLLVNVSYDNGSSAFGSRLVRVVDGGFNDTDGSVSGEMDDWTVIDSSGPPRTQLGWVLLNVNMTRTTDDPFEVRFDNGSESLGVRFNKTGSRTFNVTSNPSWSGQTEVSCVAQGDRALLDLVRGESYTDDDCVFDGSIELGDLDVVEFHGVDSAYGKYSFVTNRSDAYPTITQRCDAAPISDPCRTPAIWSANVTTTMTGDALEYRNRYNVSIYEVAN